MISFRRYSLRPGISHLEAVQLFDDHNFMLERQDVEANELVRFTFSRKDVLGEVILNRAIQKSYLQFFYNSEESVRDLDKAIEAAQNAKLKPIKLNKIDDVASLIRSRKDPKDIFYAPMSVNNKINADILAVIEEAFADKNEDLRFYACAACAYFIGWKDEITPLLQAASSDDSSEEVRRIAQKTLDSLNANNWNETQT